MHVYVLHCHRLQPHIFCTLNEWGCWQVLSDRNMSSNPQEDVPSSVEVIGLDWTSFNSLWISSHIFLIGFKSGLRAGHDIIYMLFCWTKSFMVLVERSRRYFIMLENVEPLTCENSNRWCLRTWCLPPVVCRRAHVLFKVFGLSLPPVVCRRAHVLYILFVFVCA